MKPNYLLKSDNAIRLYKEAAEQLPIIDFHNHISVMDIADDKMFENLYQLWLEPDPYKHRLMRICGVNEEFITGNATPYEKFEKFCTIFPYIVGNPVYDWSRMELSTIFGIDDIPCKENAKQIWDEANEKLKSSEFSAKGILKRFNVEYQSPVASITDELSFFDGDRLSPSLRGDNLLNPNKELLEELKEKTGKAVSNTEDYIAAVSVLLDSFHNKGCRVADHSLDSDFFDSDNNNEKQKILTLLANEYANRGWMLLLHVGAHRKTSTRLANIAGPAGGYAAVGQGFPLSKLCALLDNIELSGALPRTVVFPLNMSDQPAISVMQGSFSESGVASKVQLGPAWWWCDHALGIKNTLSCISSFGVFSEFVGMTTDSRSILSFVRHDYFRRILASWIDEQNTVNQWDLPFETQKEILTKICYQNAKNIFKSI